MGHYTMYIIKNKKEVTEMENITIVKAEYFVGMKVRAYPSERQQTIMRKNAYASKFVYNQMVAIDKELYKLSKVKIYIDTIVNRIEQLKLRKSKTI